MARERLGESRERERSSLNPDEEPRGRKCGGCGGGVRFALSLKVSQNSFPLEFCRTWSLKLLDRMEDTSAIISSSGMPPRSWVRGPMLGDDNNG